VEGRTIYFRCSREITLTATAFEYLAAIGPGTPIASSTQFLFGLFLMVRARLHPHNLSTSAYFPSYCHRLRTIFLFTRGVPLVWQARHSYSPAVVFAFYVSAKHAQSASRSWDSWHRYHGLISSLNTPIYHRVQKTRCMDCEGIFRSLPWSARQVSVYSVELHTQFPPRVTFLALGVPHTHS
jgi:hypothetical protein